ncbi:MAG: tetratricopeptide repeat protein, partial [Gammaproteobacteria bacterium]|nr:tetratricopeptide repeat protein [Gammaproteobacteria bacterium]
SSSVCEREVSLAVRWDRYVLPIYLEDTELSPTMELGIGNLQAIRRASANPEQLVAEIKPLIQHVLETGSHESVTSTEHRSSVHRSVDEKRSGFWRFLVSSVAVAVLLIIGYITVEKKFADDSPATGIRIAVLAFENFTGDVANDYLGRGLAEELLDALEKLDVLQVVPRTASFYYYGKDIPFNAITKALDVDVVLEGSLLRGEGDSIRLTTQLVDVKSDSHLWSKVYPIDVGSLIDIKQDVTRNVAINLQLQGFVQVATQPAAFNGAAYDLYLQGKNELLQQRTREDQELAESLFKESLDLVEEFIPALSGWCQIRLEMYVLSRVREDFELAEEICARLLGNDPASSDALVALGTLNRLGNNIDEALGFYQQALVLDGNNEPALYGLSRCFEAKQDFAAAERYALRSIQAERRYWKAYTGYAGFLFRQGRYLEAAQQSKQVTEITPDNPVGWGNMGTSYFAADRWEEADVAWLRAFELQPTRHGYANLATLYYYQHRFAEARELLEEAIEKYPENHRLLAKLAAIYRLEPDLAAKSQLFYKRAFETTSGGLVVNPDDAVLLGHHAYFAAAIGLPKNATDAMARAEELMPSNPEIHYLKAYVQLLLDHPDGWAEPLEKALELGYSKRQASNDPMFEKPSAISG